MAAAHLLGYSLEPRIADLGDQTLYKIDRGAAYPGLDPILTGTVKTHLIGSAWDGVVRLVASMRARTASLAHPAPARLVRARPKSGG